MLNWLLPNFGRPKSEMSLYDAIVTQSRQPALYAEYGVPDTLDGRFEMLNLHLFAVLERLKFEGEAGETVRQRLLDTFFSVLDGEFREMGVGDLSVPKKMQNVAGATLGRLQAYGEAIRDENRDALADALERNVFVPDVRHAPQPRALAGYTRMMVADLGAQPSDDVLQGKLHFPAVPRIDAAHDRATDDTVVH